MTKYLSFAGLASLMGVSCVAVSTHTETPTAPTPATAVRQQRTSVTQFYMDTCAKCHGDRGQGGGGGTRSVLTEAKFDQSMDKPFFDAIKNGVPNGGMEAYGASMSDEAIWAQVVHLRELQYKALRAERGGPKEVDGVYRGTRANYRVETVIERGAGFTVPWAIDWLPDGTMLVTNRPGFISVVKSGQITGKVNGLPPVVDSGQGGLMDVAVHPDYRKSGWIYLALSDRGEKGGSMTKIVRGKLKMAGGSADWVDQQTIFQAPQEFYSGAGHHFGSRIVFDRKGHVFFVVGERGMNMRAQELTTPYGKIFRLNDDGSEPTDNPFVGKTGGVKGVWSLGHRNPQGLTIDAEGNLWDTEHAPRGGDEVNLIQKGANYGWPVISLGINYNDTPFVQPWPTADQKFNMPAFRWLPSIGASGFDTVRGNAFPAWKGDMLAGGLSGQNLDRLRMKDGKLVEREELLWGMGRVREVAVGPDGNAYVALNEPDKIIRLVPAK